MKDKWADSDGYEMYVGRWSRQIGAAFLSWLDAPKGLRWLDLGCGTGALTAQILAHAGPASVTGIEPSEHFLAAARRQIDDHRVRLLTGSGESVPVDDASADIAVSGLVLNFIPDKQRALAELSRCVRPGGTIAVYVWDYAGHTQFMRRFWDAAVALDARAQDQDEGRRFPVCHPDALGALFSEAGLHDVATRSIDIATPFEDFDDYWTPFLSGVGPAPGYCVGLDEAARTRLRERLRETLPTDADGRILLAARAWAVRGRRA